MAKKKSHKKFSSTSENPFNVKVNRNKHSVLGQKVKGTKGKPGVSHSIGNARRREEFHKNKVLSQKANKFLDKRLLNSSQTYEDPATARLVMERKKKFRKNIFNLNDEEPLTHKGVPLVSDQSNEIIADSDDEELLDSQFVKQAHFGGFSENPAKSRKEMIDEMIVESKRCKQERKLAKEIHADLIEKLDREWKESHGSALPMMRAENERRKLEKLKEKNDPFDDLVNKLKLEKRITPANKLKTPEELAKEEEEKQRQLEEERNKRMNPVENKEVNNYLSADSIYDGLDIQSEPVEDTADDEDTADEMKEKGDDEESGGSSSDEDVVGNDDINDYESQEETIEDDVSSIPDNLENFVDRVKELDVFEVVECILKGVLKNKTKRNIEKLEKFFRILIEFALKTIDKPAKALDILDSVLPHLYTIAGISPLVTANCVLALLDKEQEKFESCKGKKLKKNFPKFSSLVVFKLVSKIYSTSDFRHPVVTPAMIFMCDILSSPYAFSYENTVSRLFICQIIYDCVSYSQRYVSEVIFFLRYTLDLAFKKNKKFNLHIDQEISLQQKPDLSFRLPNSIFNAEMKICILTEVFILLNNFAALYKDLVSYKEIFSPFLQMCRNLPANYPGFLQKEISRLTEAVNSVKTTYKPLTFVNKKPVPLKLFEPNFESKFTSKRNDIQKKRKLVKSVNQKIKKEEKCLLREIRRETQVISSEKLKERIEADEDRKRKVKQLYGELAMQEGEYKKYMKKH